jgi:hypothetical protein
MRKSSPPVEQLCGAQNEVRRGPLTVTLGMVATIVLSGVSLVAIDATSEWMNSSGGGDEANSSCVTTILVEPIAAVADSAAGDVVGWAPDLNSGGTALLIALLAAHGQQKIYIPGRIVHHAAALYRGDDKTNAKDARIIADQARMRTNLPLRQDDTSLRVSVLTPQTAPVPQSAVAGKRPVQPAHRAPEHDTGGSPQLPIG